MQIPATTISSVVTTELAYREFTSPVSVTSTSEATADTAVTAQTFAADGASAYLIEMWFDGWTHSDTLGRLRGWLYDGAASIGEVLDDQQSSSGARIGPRYMARRLIPAAANKTYSLRFSTNANTATINAGPGGIGTAAPGFIRVVKVT